MSRRLPPLLLALLGALLLSAPAPASASSEQVMIFEAPRELLQLGDGARGRMLDEIRSLGVRRVRVLMLWSSIAPAARSAKKPAGFDGADPAAYPREGWRRYDRLVAEATARGIALHVTLTGEAPVWATRAKRDQVTRPSPKEFGAYAAAAGRRYGTRVRNWSIWNEPNQPQFLLPQYDRRGRPASPRLYRRLYQAARKGLEASGNGGDEILMGETSPRGNENIVPPLAFLRGTLCLTSSLRKRRSCDRLETDGYAHHPYNPSRHPTRTEREPDDVSMSTIDRIVRVLDRGARVGAVRPGLGVFVTEFGTQSIPDRFGLSLLRQAEYNAISERLAYLNPRVRSFSQYLMIDDPPGPNQDHAGFETGLRTFDGRAKPAYDGFRTPLVVTDRGRRSELWGLIRPAGEVTELRVEYRDGRISPWRTLRTARTDERSVFRFTTRTRADRRYRVVWTSEDGRVYNGPATRAYR